MLLAIVLTPVVSAALHAALKKPPFETYCLGRLALFFSVGP